MERENTFEIMKNEDIPYISRNSIPQSEAIWKNRHLEVTELYDLCSKTKYKDKTLLFYKALMYYDILSFKVHKNPKANLNGNQCILHSFYFAIKFTQNRVNIPMVNQLRLFNRKYSSIDSKAFLLNEMICLQLLNFKMVYSSPYDYLLMFLSNKPLLLEKARDSLNKLMPHQVYVCFSPYFIACGVITYTLASQGQRDSYLIKRFCINKEGTCYQLIVKALKSTTKVYSNASTSEGSPTTDDANTPSNSETIISEYKKLREKSKNIELFQTNQLIQINMALTQTKEMVEEEDMNAMKTLMNFKAQAKKSCINIFSASKKLTRNEGTITLGIAPVIGNSKTMKDSIEDFVTNRSQCRVNIDLQSLSRISMKPTPKKTNK